MGGLANYTGDIQQKRLTMQQSNAVVTFGGTVNITQKLMLRTDLSFAKVGADDKFNRKRMLVGRNLNFKTNITEFAILGEYDLLNLSRYPATPYVFGGVGLFHFNPYTNDSRGNKVYLRNLSTEGQGILPNTAMYKTTQFNLPIGGGLKYAVSDQIQIAVEMGLRVLNTDFLDDLSGNYVDENLLLQARGEQAVDVAYRGDELKTNPGRYPAGGSIRGNPKVKDYYYFGTFRISFGMPWFNNRGRGLGCPTWKW